MTKQKRGGAGKPELTLLDVLRAIEAATARIDRAIAKYDSPIQAVHAAQVRPLPAIADVARPRPKSVAKASTQRSSASPTKSAADLRRETQAMRRWTQALRRWTRALRRWTQALRRSKTLTPRLAQQFAELKRRHPGRAPSLNVRNRPDEVRPTGRIVRTPVDNL